METNLEIIEQNCGNQPENQEFLLLETIQILFLKTIQILKL